MLEVLILAGGLATRLKPHTEKIPKSLVQVCGKPFIYHQLDLMLTQGVKRVIMSVGHYGEMIEKELGRRYKGQIEIDYAFDGEVLLGTGGAIQNSLDKIKENYFIITYGDSYLLEPMSNIISAFNHREYDAILTVYKNKNHWDKSNCIYESGRVVLYDKENPTPDMHYIDYGMSIFSKKTFESKIINKPYDLATIMNGLSKTKRLAGYEAKSRFYEMGSHNGLAELDAYLRNVDNEN